MSLLAAIGSYPITQSIASFLGSEWIVAPSGTISHSLRTAATNGNLYVASDTPTSAVSTTYVSNDGLSWNTYAGKTGGFRGLLWDHVLQKFFAGEGSTGTISNTTDGITWSSSAQGSPQWNGFSRNNTTLVAVGNSGSIRTTTDGVTWTIRSSGGSNALYSAVWDETRGRFLSLDHLCFCAVKTILEQTG